MKNTKYQLLPHITYSQLNVTQYQVTPRDVSIKNSIYKWTVIVRKQKLKFKATFKPINNEYIIKQLSVEKKKIGVTRHSLPAVKINRKFSAVLKYLVILQHKKTDIFFRNKH